VTRKRIRGLVYVDLSPLGWRGGGGRKFRDRCFFIPREQEGGEGGEDILILVEEGRASFTHSAGKERTQVPSFFAKCEARKKKKKTYSLMALNSEGKKLRLSCSGGRKKKGKRKDHVFQREKER